MYNALKNAGIPLDKHYREYSEADLRPAYEKLMEHQAAQEQADSVNAEHFPPDTAPPDPEAAAFFGYQPSPTPVAGAPVAGEGYAEPEPTPQPSYTGVASRDPEEFAGQRQNTNPNALEPIRTDEHGRVWYQEEVLKPAYAKPRGRRVLQYQDSGVEKKTVKTGDFTESFEVAGTGPARVSEVKITLPSYQVGIFKDPRFPFRVHTYAGNNGFDLFEVQEFYGGAELVPAEIKRIYVENVLCYDIRTTVRAIETEARQLQLQNRIPTR